MSDAISAKDFLEIINRRCRAVRREHPNWNAFAVVSAFGIELGVNDCDPLDAKQSIRLFTHDEAIDMTEEELATEFGKLAMNVAAQAPPKRVN